MKQLIVGVGVGLLLGSAAMGEEQARVQRLTEVKTMAAGGGGAVFQVPPEYGRLADVAVSSDVQYLYFVDDAGAVRVVLMGPRGAVQRSRNPLQLLTNDAYLIERGRPADAPAS